MEVLRSDFSNGQWWSLRKIRVEGKELLSFLFHEHSNREWILWPFFWLIQHNLAVSLEDINILLTTLLFIENFLSKSIKIIALEIFF